MVGEIVYVVGTKQGIYENNEYKHIYCIKPANSVNGFTAECLKCDCTSVQCLPEPGTFVELSFNRWQKVIGVDEVDNVSAEFVSLINSVFAVSVVSDEVTQ